MPVCVQNLFGGSHLDMQYACNQNSIIVGDVKKFFPGRVPGLHAVQFISRNWLDGFKVFATRSQPWQRGS